MFCDGCGKEMQVGQLYCSGCGKPSPASAIPQQPLSKVARHLPVLAVLWMVYAAFTLIGAGVLFVLGMTIFGPWSQLHQTPEFPADPRFLHLLFMFLGTLILFKAIASLAAGIGLLQRQPWGRTLALVLAFISLLNVPFGTALGIYTIWVLMSPKAAEEYQRLSESPS